MRLSGSTRWPLYFLAAQAACLPLSPRAYASINRRERLANLGSNTAGLRAYLVVRKIRPLSDLIAELTPETVWGLYSGTVLGFSRLKSVVMLTASCPESSNASIFGRLRVFRGDKCSKRRFAPLAKFSSRLRTRPGRLGM
jgi:hypothetical protein